MELLGCAILADQVYGIERNRIAGSAAHGDAERVGAHDFKSEHLLILLQQVQRAGVSIGDALRGNQNGFQQAVDIPLAGKRNPNGIQLFKPVQQIVALCHDCAYPAME